MDVELRQEKASGVFRNYQVPPQFLDEVFTASGEIKPVYETVYKQFLKYSNEDFRALNEHAKITFLNQGITFSVYSDKSRGVERIFPFDLFPRIIPAGEWTRLEEGLIQRNVAMNLFIQDIYNKQHI